MPPRCGNSNARRLLCDPLRVRLLKERSDQQMTSQMSFARVSTPTIDHSSYFVDRCEEWDAVLNDDLVAACLGGAMLRGVRLAGRDLTLADASGADLRIADLSGAILASATL